MRAAERVLAADPAWCKHPLGGLRTTIARKLWDFKPKFVSVEPKRLLFCQWVIYNVAITKPKQSKLKRKLWALVWCKVVPMLVGWPVGMGKPAVRTLVTLAGLRQASCTSTRTHACAQVVCKRTNHIIDIHRTYTTCACVPLPKTHLHAHVHGSSIHANWTACGLLNT